MMTFACGAVGFFAFAALPVGLELSVESTFPVNESLSAGLIWIFSQVRPTLPVSSLLRHLLVPSGLNHI
jgi:FLVCR family MFS transporter 7